MKDSLNVKLVDIQYTKKLVAGLKLDLFQELFWWELIEKGFDKRCKVALITKHHENMALLPLFFHKIGPLIRVGSPLRGTFTPYIDFIWLAEGIEIEQKKKYIKIIAEYLIEDGIRWIELSFSSAGEEIYGCLAELNFKDSQSNTLILNTDKTEENLWIGMEGRARNLVRKAEKSDLIVKYLNPNDKNVDIFYSLLESTFAKNKMKPPHSKYFYKLLIDKLITTNNLLFLSVEKDAKIVAMGIFLFNSIQIHFISGTSSAIGNKFGANNLMHWEVIKFASRKNINKYDFGGLGIKSIDKFKQSFGGGNDNYISYTWMTPLVRAMFNLLNLVRSKIKIF